MKALTTLVVTLALGLGTNLALAGDGSPGSKGEHHGDKHHMKDCSKITDDAKKAKCESHKAAMETCKDMKGPDHKKCMMDNMPKKEEKK